MAQRKSLVPLSSRHVLSGVYAARPPANIGENVIYISIDEPARFSLSDGVSTWLEFPFGSLDTPVSATPLQPGVVGNSDFTLTVDSSSQVTISSGTFLFRSEGQYVAATAEAPTSLSGIPAASASNYRVDQVVLNLDTETVTRVQGTQGTTTDLLNRTGATALTSAQARLYDMLVTPSGVVITGTGKDAAGTSGWGGITNLSGIHTLPTGTVTVASTAGFQSSGRFIVNGQTVAYTGKTGTTFTGCTGGTGAQPDFSFVYQDIVRDRRVRANGYHYIASTLETNGVADDYYWNNSGSVLRPIGSATMNVPPIRGFEVGVEAIKSGHSGTHYNSGAAGVPIWQEAGSQVQNYGAILGSASFQSTEALLKFTPGYHVVEHWGHVSSGAGNGHYAYGNASTRPFTFWYTAASLDG
jgi:hypothetical protein